MHVLKYNIFILFWLFIEFKTCIAYIHMQTITSGCVCRHNNVWTTIACLHQHQFQMYLEQHYNVFLERLILWIHKISYPWWMKMYIYSNLNTMFQLQSMTYQKLWKPFVVDVFISVFIYENYLDHIIYDDNTNYTIQINNMLHYNPKTIECK
jgi:hypothetical protein